LSTLDIVLQRQVPVRSAAKMGGDALGADAGGARADDAFSSVLSGQKRSTDAARDQIDRKADPDPASDRGAGTEADGLETPTSAARKQSDDMLSLLEGLMSSASFSDDTGLPSGEGQSTFSDDTGSPSGEGQSTDLPGPAEDEALVPEATADDSALGHSGAVQQPAETISVGKADAAETGVSADAGAQMEPVSLKTPASSGADERTMPERDRTAAQPAASAAQAAVAPAVAGQVAPASAPVAAAQNGGTGRAGQGAQAPQASGKPQPSVSAASHGKVSSEDKEIVRSLGMVDEQFTRSDSKNAAAGEGFTGSGRKSATVARTAEEPVSAKAGAVEVIESRRFMPTQALSGNAQMVTRSLIEAGDAALAAQRTAPAQATAAAQPQSGQMLHTLKIQLNPVSLGSVTAVLKLTGEELSVSIKVETAEAYRQLSDDNQAIVKAMRAQGYAVEQITVQHVPSGDRSGNGAQQQGFQGGFQGSGSGDAQSSERGNDGRSAGQQGANQHGGQGREQSQHPGSGSGRSDGVYL